MALNLLFRETNDFKIQKFFYFANLDWINQLNYEKAVMVYWDSNPGSQNGQIH